MWSWHEIFIIDLNTTVVALHNFCFSECIERYYFHQIRLGEPQEKKAFQKEIHLSQVNPKVPGGVGGGGGVEKCKF